MKPKNNDENNTNSRILKTIRCITLCLALRSADSSPRVVQLIRETHADGTWVLLSIFQVGSRCLKMPQDVGNNSQTRILTMILTILVLLNLLFQVL